MLNANEVIKGTNTYLTSDKFDPSQSILAMNAALSEYYNKVSQQGPVYILNTRDAITRDIKHDIGVLTAIFPCFITIIGESMTTPTKVAPRRIAELLQICLSYVYSSVIQPGPSCHPFLDDLRWANKLPLQLNTCLYDSCYNPLALKMRDNDVKYPKMKLLDIWPR